MPRLFTPPLVTGPPGPCGCGCALTPETSQGFEVVDFATEVRHPFLPWQRFAAIHGGELLPDGRPRFRIVLLIVARQNGKTTLPVVFAPYWQFRKRVPLILGTSTKLPYAKEAWRKSVNLVKRTRAFDDLHEPGRKWYRLTNGETESWTYDDCRHVIAAANDEGGRSLTIDRGIADELRQHHTYDAWGAFEPACSPDDAQIWALSNAGSLKSVVLNDLQDQARTYIETGVGDPRLGLLEWSAPEDADPEDVEALLQANPRVGYGLDLDVLLAAGAQAKRLGGEALTFHKTERMCIRVKLLNPALDQEAWADCLVVGGLDQVRGRVAMVWDVAPDLLSVVLYAAAVRPDARVQIDAVKEWKGSGCTRQAMRDLPALIGRTKPAAVGWLPAGPGAAFAADMVPRPGVWPPVGVNLAEIKSELPAVCMGFDELIRTRQLARSGRQDGGVVVGDPLLDSQVETAEWLIQGDRKVFSRRGEGHVNALYAAAGAAHLARTLPPDLGPFIIW